MKPRIGLLLGDPNGIGPELVAKLLAQPEVLKRGEILVIGDLKLFHRGEQVAQTQSPVRPVKNPSQIRFDTGQPVFLDVPTIDSAEITPGEATAAGGHSVLKTLELALELAQDGAIDAICFAPLNKYAMRLAGLQFEDELHFFSHKLGHPGPCGELNVLGKLWTSRVTSHVALKDVCGMISAASITQAIQLVHDTLSQAGYPQPRIAVAALNPHAGDGGMFGREEIDVIRPAVVQARRRQIAADGPFPADTVFLKARDGDYDAVVTMYHDQGQIAMKLMGFERGVTVQGGLPIPITTPAHGTAYDIVGQNKAYLEATRQAFLLACEMGSKRRANVKYSGGLHNP